MVLQNWEEGSTPATDQKLSDFQKGALRTLADQLEGMVESLQYHQLELARQGKMKAQQDVEEVRQRLDDCRADLSTIIAEHGGAE